MLPSFRFLFAAIMLSTSILVFGLGAAALLRTAHEEFASNPFWHAAPETTFAQQSDGSRPVLAMLRLDPVPVEQRAADDAPSVAAPVEPAASASVAVEPETIAALGPELSPQPESAQPEIPVPESPAPSELPSAQAEASAGETKLATTEDASPPANEAAPTASEQTSAPALPEPDLAVAKIAALDAPTVAIEAKPPAKAASAKTTGAEPDKSAIKKREQARRAAQRRRIAARARAARQAAQQAADPFAQPIAQPAAVARSR
jgi:hypothetical protein